MHYKGEINKYAVSGVSWQNKYFLSLQENYSGKKSAVQKRDYLFLGFDEDDKLGGFFAKGKHN